MLTNFTSDSVYFQYVDVRLFFIVIVATVWGLRCGIVAAVLECLALIREYSLIGVSAVQLFYVIENWLPFAVYVMAGTITGYVRDQKTKEIEFSNKEYELLRNKYIFLNDVHQNSLQNKSEYKRQILGFKDSFGKIFDAVQKLEGERPEDIFIDGLAVLEDILQNNSIAIYSVEAGQRFGRLIICSGALTESLAKSIRLEDGGDMFETVTEGGIWRNMELEEEKPMYAGGVFRDGQIVLLLTVQEAKTGQLGMDYVNIFHILCGLVQNAFLKALRYEELQEEENYISGTRVLRPKRLKEFLKVQEEMKRAGTADYVLLRLEEKNVDAAQSSLSGIVRTSDRLGAGEDGTLYLVLVQANLQSVGIVEERLKTREISYEIVEKVN
ncbi:MAG: hypothetical protein LUC90_02830 [Lachnospiraceae bacterium]|nr:hypothetical protein [Lachnospiraceae bacterium]